jgi:hypothetical protein
LLFGYRRAGQGAFHGAQEAFRIKHRKETEMIIDHRTGLVAIAVSLMAVGAHAQSTPVEDANGDGIYSFKEVQAAFPDVTEDAYQSLDANGDGALSANEVSQGVADGKLG